MLRASLVACASQTSAAQQLAGGMLVVPQLADLAQALPLLAKQIDSLGAPAQGFTLHVAVSGDDAHALALPADQQLALAQADALANCPSLATGSELAAEMDSLLRQSSTATPPQVSGSNRTAGDGLL